MTSSTQRSWGSRQHASSIRLVVIGIWAASIALTPYNLYARLPDEVVSGFGFWRVLLAHNAVRAVLFDPTVLSILKYSAIATAAFAALSTRHARWSTPVLLGLVLVLDGLTKSIGGFVNHGQAATLLTLAVFAYFNRLDYLSLPSVFSRARHGGPEDPRAADGFAAVVWLTSLIVVVPYTFIGLNRLLVGGLDVFKGDAILYYLRTSSRDGASYPSWMDLAHFGGLFKIGFAVVTFFEVSASLALLSERFRRLWLVVILGFHLTTVVTMNILFWENWLLIAVTFWWGWRGTAGSRRARILVAWPGSA